MDDDRAPAPRFSKPTPFQATARRTTCSNLTDDRGLGVWPEGLKERSGSRLPVRITSWVSDNEVEGHGIAGDKARVEAAAVGWRCRLQVNASVGTEVHRGLMNNDSVGAEDFELGKCT